MPFGLSNTPKTFKRKIPKLFGYIPQIKTFLDDILIFTETEKEHVSVLKKVIQVIENNNINLNLRKYEFNKKEIKIS